MSESRSPLSQVLELAVFGPIGLALSITEDLPKWVERGRSQMTRQFETARVVGEHAARHGRRRLTSELVGMGLIPGPQPPATHVPTTVVDDHEALHSPPSVGRSGHDTGTNPPTASPGDRGQGSADSGVVSAIGTASGRSTQARAKRQGQRGSRSPGRAAGSVERPGRSVGDDGDKGLAQADEGLVRPDGTAELAIPGYDSLSAFQVVQRLPSLAPPELEAVRGYEAAGRGRRTILTKISQLQTGRP